MCQPVQRATTPASNGPTAAPILPVPSIIAVTVAKALELFPKLGWVPNSADTAVVIKAYGPFTNKPAISSSIMLNVHPVLPI